MPKMDSISKFKKEQQGNIFATHVSEEEPISSRENQAKNTNTSFLEKTMNIVY